MNNGLTLFLIVAQMQSTKGDRLDPSYKILQKELIGFETDYDNEIPTGCATLHDYRVRQADIDGISFNPYMDRAESKWLDYEYSVE